MTVDPEEYCTSSFPVASNTRSPTTWSPGDESDEAVGRNQSNPEPCTVAGNLYAHGQQVPREDPCEFCLCLDGELFCWWQDCPPSSTGPCRASRAFTACANASAENVGISSTAMAAMITSSSPGPTEPEEPPASSHVTTGDAASSSDANPSTDVPAMTTAAATACYVMGTEYKIGEVLPRDTGTCLECVCDSEARVTCSPKDCASREDYRASNSLDMFDVDTF